mgnify:CR=1 FL=1
MLTYQDFKNYSTFISFLRENKNIIKNNSTLFADVDFSNLENNLSERAKSLNALIDAKYNDAHKELNKNNKSEDLLDSVMNDIKPDFNIILNEFSYELIDLLPFYSNSEFPKCFYHHPIEEKKYHKFKTLKKNIISLTQVCFNEKQSIDLTIDIYYKLKNIYNQSAFNDNRFTTFPVCCNENLTHGKNASEWMIPKHGGFVKQINKEKTAVNIISVEIAYYNFMLDARLGIYFYFKNKPCFWITFNFDNNKNIYINQIQSALKGRGHYRLKGIWQKHVINFLQELFVDYNFFIISPNSVIDIVKSYYTENSPDFFRPSKETLNRIHNKYQQLNDNQLKINKNNIEYYKIS